MFNKLFFATLICSLFAFSSCERYDDSFQSRNVCCWTPKGNILLFTTTSPSTCDIVGFETPDSIMEDLTLPSEIYFENRAYTVNRIASYAFWFNSCLHSVVVSEGITAVGREAFRRCDSLETVVLSDGVKSLGLNCFMDSRKLATINLQSSITTIDNMSFVGCTSLKNVRFEASVDTLHFAVFQDCDSLRDIHLPEGIRIVEGQVFAYSGLRELILPEGVTTVHTDIVNHCEDLKHISFPSTVKSLELQHLDCDSLEYFDVKAISPPYLYLYFFCLNEDMKVRVPAESLEAYRKAEVWRSLNIEALPD